MATQSTDGWISNLLQFFAAYSDVIYIAGVLVISIPVVLAWVFEIFVSSTVRFMVVGASLSVMILAYIGERRARFPDAEKSLDERKREYSTRTRLLVAGAVLGLGLGIYSAIEINLLVGGVFFIGAYLFTRLAFNSTEDTQGE